MKKNNYAGESAYTTDIASSYENDRNVEEHWHEEQKYAEKLIRALPDESRVLDIPVGTGRFFEYYQAKNVQVVGMDISESMLVEAGKKVGSHAIELMPGDARALDYPDNSFDCVLCWRLLHLLPSEVLREVIFELTRVTSGRLYIQAYVRDHHYYPIRCQRMIERLLARIRAPRQNRTKPWSHIQSHAHRETMLFKLFQECGLRISAVDNLGVYGALKVKVFVLEKV